MSASLKNSCILIINNKFRGNETDIARQIQDIKELDRYINRGSLYYLSCDLSTRNNEECFNDVVQFIQES